jgi:hypothetical protein
MSYWAVVRSLPKREAFAAERLRMDHGYEVFLPLDQTKRASAPLFSGYFFCRIVDRWRARSIAASAFCVWSCSSSGSPIDLPVAASHNRAVPSLEAVTIRLPSRLNDALIFN